MTEETRLTIAKLALDRANWMLYREHMTVAFRAQGLSEHLTATTFPARYATTSSKGGLTGQEWWGAEEFAFKDLIGHVGPAQGYVRGMTERTYNQLPAETLKHKLQGG
jgi:hypothetical protein